MPQKKLEVRSLPDLDNGRPVAVIDAEIQRVLEDMHDRPAVKKDRSVTVKLSFKPVLNSDGSLEDVKLEMDIKSSVPSQASPTYTLMPTKAGMKFSTTSKDARQRTLEDELEEKDAGEKDGDS